MCLPTHCWKIKSGANRQSNRAQKNVAPDLIDLGPFLAYGFCAEGNGSRQNRFVTSGKGLALRVGLRGPCLKI